MFSIISAHCKDLRTWQNLCLLFDITYRDYFIFNKFKNTNNSETISYNENERFEIYYEDNNYLCLYYVKNGLIDGKSISFYSNGKIATQCTYKDGKREGLHYLYNDDGKLLLTGLYVNNVEKEIYFKF